MARRLRIPFPGARYHVINRGNLRHDIFATAGARRSFVGMAWRLGTAVAPARHRPGSRRLRESIQAVTGILGLSRRDREGRRE